MPNPKFNAGKDITFSLTPDEFDSLLLMAGYAIGAAFPDNRKLAYAFLRLANRLNEGNPNWTPYQIPDHHNLEAQ